MNLDRFRKACDRVWRKIRKEPPTVFTFPNDQPLEWRPLRSQPLNPDDPATKARILRSFAQGKEIPMPTTNDSNTYFKLFQSKKNKQWYFSIHGGNHRIIAQSEGYKRKESAEKAIATLKRETATATVKE